MARMLDLKTKLENTKKGGMKLEEYFQKIKHLTDALAAAGRQVSLEDHILYILLGLGPEYDSVVSVITDKEETPSVQKVYSLLMAQESRNDRHNSINPDGSTSSVNLAQSQHKHNSTKKFSPSANTDNNRSNGNRSKNQGNRSNGKRFWNNNGKPQCQVCGRFGHTALQCFSLFERLFPGPTSATNHQPPSHNNSGMSHNLPQQPLNAFTVQHDMNKESQWFPDSGASNHVTNDLANLTFGSEYQGDNKVHIGSQWPNTSSR